MLLVNELIKLVVPKNSTTSLLFSFIINTLGATAVRLLSSLKTKQIKTASYLLPFENLKNLKTPEN